ncbi:MAG: hypothetical protein M1830_006441 [Pleopsidium flavum]|nr:MAG: hypothetical protein M1830_006441 [Pleopsidium flavum]
MLDNLLSKDTLQPPNETLHLPRILCLHGGGVTGDIFKAQARALIKHLPDFRLVFANAPFFSGPGPDIIPVYEDYGPFRRWLRWRPEHPEIDSEAAAKMIISSLERCKQEDKGDGPWVGLLGFSQGAKIAASLLYDQQIRVERERKADTDYRFAVLLAGRGPLLSFCHHSASPALMTAGQMSLESFDYPGKSLHVLRLPTIHVHGLNDEGLYWHRKMLKQYHDPKTSTLIEWKGAHRVPLKRADVMKVATEVYRVAQEQGIDVPC